MAMPSSEDPVQEPARRTKLALLIETFAEHPIAMPVLVLDAVIVAWSRSE
jgi:hypothetical protein